LYYILGNIHFSKNMENPNTQETANAIIFSIISQERTLKEWIGFYEWLTGTQLFPTALTPLDHYSKLTHEDFLEKTSGLHQNVRTVLTATTIISAILQGKQPAPNSRKELQALVQKACKTSDPESANAPSNTEIPTSEKIRKIFER
jgi:hypothetical protein